VRIGRVTQASSLRIIGMMDYWIKSPFFKGGGGVNLEYLMNMNTCYFVEWRTTPAFGHPSFVRRGVRSDIPTC